MLRRRRLAYASSTSTSDNLIASTSTNDQHATVSTHTYRLIIKHALACYLGFSLTLLILMLISRKEQTAYPKPLSKSVWRSIPRVPKHPPRPLREGILENGYQIKWWPEIESDKYDTSKQSTTDKAIGIITV